MSGMDLIFRKVERHDVDNLLSLLIESNPSLKITRASLERDLACGDELELIDAQQALKNHEDDNGNLATFELDLELAKSNVPALQGFLAEVGHGDDNSRQPVGLVLFHYHYSPWTGHTAFINKIYVRPVHRNKGIATGLLERMRSLCKREGISRLLYETSRMPEDLVTRIAKHGMRVYRNDDTDWCVFRIDFN